MSKSVKRIICMLLILLTVCTPTGILPSAVSASAAVIDDMNLESVFVKQQTPVTCTLASAAMLMRRTAIAAGYTDWEAITEENIRSVAWVDGTGLLWNFTYNNLTVGHGYFAGDNNKLEILNMLEKYPQGFVIYNFRNGGQQHAVILCDYDEETDTFYVSDPASNAPEGRITLMDSTIVGNSQDEKLDNLNAYWYIVSPEVSLDESGELSVSWDGNGGSASDKPPYYQPDPDLTSYNTSKKAVNDYYVVSDETAGGCALRYYPSGNSSAYKYVKKGEILYIESVGQNNFGATWYKTSSEYYIFSSNLTRFDKYSAETVKFENTAESVDATYFVNASNGSSTPLRLEPAEGNNIVAYADNDTLLYIVSKGVNSVGSMWLKTEDGYYVKNSQMDYKASGKLADVGYKGEFIALTGNYSCKPLEDLPEETPMEPVDYTITASALNVRKAPVDGTVIGSLAFGTKVKVVAVAGDWGKIDYSGEEGWISLEYAEKITETAIPVKIEAIKLSKDLVMSGDSIECTVTVTNDAPCLYKFYVYNDMGEIVHSAGKFSVRNEYSFTPEKSGVYYFGVEIQTSDNKTITGYGSNFTVHNNLQLGSVKSSVDEFAYTYDEIIWTVDTISDSVGSMYVYSVYLDGVLLFEDESVSGVFSYIPSQAGIYVLKVYLEDDYTTSEEIACEPVSIYASLQIDSIKLNSASVVVGSEVICSVDASGGVGEYAYCFSVFKDDKVFKNGAFGSANESINTFTQEGTYKIFCTVKDSSNTIVSAFSSEIIVFDMLAGDADGDGRITAGDSRTVLRYSAGMDKLQQNAILACDVNKDSRITASDARIILRCAANIEKI